MDFPVVFMYNVFVKHKTWRLFMKLQKLYSYTRKAMDDFQMIKENDSIAVGISGGKDSLTVICPGWFTQILSGALLSYCHNS